MLSEQIEEMRSRCIGCGACENVCPSSKYSDCNPYLIMTTGDGDLLNCIACHSCSNVCENTDPCNTIKKMVALKYDLHTPDSYKETGFSAPITEISRNELKPQWTGGDVQILTGCIIECMADFLEYATYISLDHLGIKCRMIDGNACCLRPAIFSEIPAEQKMKAKESIMRTAEDNTVLALCGGCAEEMENICNGAVNTIDFFYRYIDRLPKLRHRLKVAIEPGCSLSYINDKLVKIAEATGCEYVKNEYGCCGKNTPIAPKLMADREEECRDSDIILVACPKCFTKYDSFPDGKPVMYITELIALAAGDSSSLRYHKIPFGDILDS